jgi:hypothetical protein
VAHEAVQVGLAGEPLEVAADHRIRLGQLDEALLGSVLALVAHVVHQALAVQRGADHSGGGLEGGELRGIDGAMLPRVVEAHDARELAGDEYRHDRLGLGADALDEGERIPGRGLLLAEAHAAPGAQLRADVGVLPLIARAGRGDRR